MSEAREAEDAVHAEREASFLLAVPEKRFLRWLAGKLPRWILPDDMTAIGACRPGLAKLSRCEAPG